MKHVINDRKNLVDEMIAGIVASYDGKIKKVANVNGIVKTNIEEGKVALLVGGGSGHEPIYHGLVGKNMADAAAIGNIFASPNPEVIYETAKAADQGNGILFLYGNYSGDNMNFDIAAEMLEDDGINVKTVRIKDDVATDNRDERRGISGLVFAVKVAGAVCSKQHSLDEAYRITLKTVEQTRSMGVALEAGVMLNTEEPTFVLGENEIEIGMGIHGEPGVERTKLKSSKEIVTIMLDKILKDLPFSRGNEVALLINDLGSMTNMELLIANKTISEILLSYGVKKISSQIGKIATTMDMKGFSISLLKLDEELKEYFFVDSNSLAFSFCEG
jgi:dihydroxyacetone kinase-like protein